MLNTMKIKGRMAELGITQKDVGAALHIAPATANQKINNIRPMDLGQAENLANLLKIEDKDFGIYFFA